MFAGRPFVHSTGALCADLKVRTYVRSPDHPITRSRDRPITPSPDHPITQSPRTRAPAHESHGRTWAPAAPAARAHRRPWWSR